MTSAIPHPPRSYLNSFGQTLASEFNKEVELIEEEMRLNEEQRKEEIYKYSQEINTKICILNQHLRSGNFEAAEPLIADNVERIGLILKCIGDDAVKRERTLGYLIEKATVPRLLHGFFVTGRILEQSALQPCSDDEYVASVLSFAQELPRYAVNRACEGDIKSVGIARNVVNELIGKFLEFDFRNGPLRRKWDGLKYCLKTIEDIDFELSLQKPIDTAAAAASDEDLKGEGERPTKMARIEETTGGVEEETSAKHVAPTFNSFNAAELDAIRGRMEVYDKAREQLIKDSRDVQKLAKLAIYAVIRGSLADARSKLDSAKSKASAIMTVVDQFPSLRQGSFTACLEEWAEGFLCLEWCENKRIASKAECAIINTVEYVGALSDFTGEIGRLAVFQASKHNLDAVKEIHQVDIIISEGLNRVNVGNRFGKKLDAIYTNMGKVENIVLELTLLKLSGKTRRSVAATSISIAPHGSAGDAKAGDDDEE